MKRAMVCGAARALAHDHAIPRHAASFERSQDVIGGAGSDYAEIVLSGIDKAEGVEILFAAA